MAKTRSGLPEGFDISVTGSDLTGPVTLPGYLDDDPVVRFAKTQVQGIGPLTKSVPSQALPQAERKIAPSRTTAVAAQTATGNLSAGVPVTAEAASTAAVSVKSPDVRRRLQINLDAEAEQMVEELLDLLSNQSAEHRIKVSELFQALLLNIYKARGEIALGSLPIRGRWGSPTARAFPVALAEALREAILEHEKVSSGNPFQKAVGA